MSLLRLSPGSVFAGDYQIVSPLAEGGMGSVYVAKQLSTGKERALKILQAQFIRDDRTRDRFTREARAGSQVDSEHVVEVVGAGIDKETGVPWLAMELLRGEDLEAFARRLGPLGPAQVLEIFRQLCHGLGAAHASGLVHRDLKPENVFLATARRVGVPFTVKILDFGIAKVTHDTNPHATDAVGTPTWMAPEQTEAGRPITPAADVWALGLIAFRLLAGVYYWKSANVDDAGSMSILREVVFDPMEPASSRARALGSPVKLSPDFDGWFARAVSRDPSTRFANATMALASLESALGRPSLHASGAIQMTPLDQPPPTVPGTPFGALVSDAPPSTVPATRVGPFTGPSTDPHPPRALSSLPPPEDVDSYEKRLSRGKLWVRLGAVAVLAIAGAGAYQVRKRVDQAPVFDGREHEPNDRAPDATAVPYGQKVLGQIGQRIDAERSDRDFYRITVPKESKVLRLSYKALPNIAPCLFFYRVGTDEPLLRYCTGAPGRDLTLPSLHLEPNDYFVAVMQDREQYTEAPPPKVLENVSDDYELTLGPGDEQPDLETEPNDQHDSAERVAPGATLRGRLSVMRDQDVFCVTDPDGTQIVVEDPSPRARGAVLEVTPEGGPSDGIPVRVHPPGTKGAVTERDVRSPWKSPKHGNATSCVTVTLVPDVWSEPPLPRVAPASDHEYVVRVVRL
ncbi:MAG TPA: serine/threonine-protein kinase [Polyangiaceae bacterium]|nr:serine/threonine-protein kinase [Polyangiaceae bacterium]